MKRLIWFLLGLFIMAGAYAGFTVLNGDIVFNGVVKLTGSGVASDDLTVPGFSFKGGATPPNLVDYTGQSGTTGIQLYCFDGIATKEVVMFQMQLPHKRKQGSNIHPHVHRTKSTTDAGDVKWNMTCDWINIHGTLGTDFHTVSGVAGPTTGWYHEMTNMDEMDGGGKTISSMLSCVLFRDPADDSDTYEHDACILQFDRHYDIDSIGSDGEYIKSF